MNINYGFIHNSQDYYDKKGFVNIETPWLVSQDVIQITKPADTGKDYKVNHQKALVASGEQSFLYLISKGQLPDGKWQTTTPCFRDEVSFIHRKFFIKNELIWLNPVESGGAFIEIIDSAFGFFQEYIKDVELIQTSSGNDIVYKGIELGSYGIREYMGTTWVYGTGCAEPRLSMALQMVDKC